jgi:membrane protease YdiL (CAAX protease family)
VMNSIGWPLTEPPIFELLKNSHGMLFWGSAVVIVVGLAAVAEEILFRKVLHDAVARYLPQQAMLVTSFLFALAHGVPEQVLPLILLGIVLQMSRRRFRSLWPAILLHGIYNAISLTLLKLGIECGL